MDPITNPYAPGAGSQPPELAGRDDVLNRTRVTLGRIKHGRPAKSFMLVGLRGVGKTVLLNRIQEISEEAGYISAMVETPENKSLPEVLLPCLRRILLQLDTKERVNEVVKRSLMILKGFANALKVSVGEIEFGLTIEPAPGIADSGDLDADLPDLFEAVGHAAKARGTAVALIIDEMQYIAEAEFSALIMAVHRLSQRQLPVVVIGAGLPQLVGLAGKSKSYAERLFDYPQIGPLNDADARAALIEPATREGAAYEDGAVDKVLALTKGYPYFIQEWGYHGWNTARQSPITPSDIELATRTAVASLDESFFRVRFDRLTPREKAYMFAMAALGPGPHRSGDIAAGLRVAVESVAPLRSSLIRKGMVYSPAHGDTAFTVPMFDEFLKRQQSLT
ncbi:AAA family ATPase [Novosphingobium piscinae]|uniref:ATP-binding protein n=1 Tax=Novosphingobium piscinae TaxID=1507448 RepID=A0A7X1G1B3_9SPHN|nr:ATP-binding protein [Novosphingobium piscinae]MBC2670791.1 ATP-binding protein [Novosphingobium piscinae]